MPFEKGNNLGKGRPQGKPNKTTQEIKQMFQCLLEDNINTLQDDLKGLEPKDRIKAILDLAKLVLPSKQEHEISTTNLAMPTIIVNDANTQQAFEELKRMFEDEQLN